MKIQLHYYSLMMRTEKVLEM